MPVNDDIQRFPVRKNPRMKHYDYRTPNYYFITMCTHEKQCMFGMGDRLTAYGLLAQQGLAELEQHFPDIKVDKFVVMPNHVHAILVLQENSAALSVVIGQYKSFVARMIHRTEPEKKIWQTSYHDHVIRNQKSYENIWLYIDSNPSNWSKDCFFTDLTTI